MEKHEGWMSQWKRQRVRRRWRWEHCFRVQDIVATDALSKRLRAKASDAARIVLETDSLAGRLRHELRGRNFRVISWMRDMPALHCRCVSTRSIATTCVASPNSSGWPRATRTVSK